MTPVEHPEYLSDDGGSVQFVRYDLAANEDAVIAYMTYEGLCDDRPWQIDAVWMKPDGEGPRGHPEIWYRIVPAALGVVRYWRLQPRRDSLSANLPASACEATDQLVTRHGGAGAVRKLAETIEGIDPESEYYGSPEDQVGRIVGITDEGMRAFGLDPAKERKYQPSGIGAWCVHDEDEALRLRAAIQEVLARSDVGIVSYEILRKALL